MQHTASSSSVTARHQIADDGHVQRVHSPNGPKSCDMKNILSRGPFRHVSVPFPTGFWRSHHSLMWMLLMIMRSLPLATFLLSTPFVVAWVPHTHKQGAPLFGAAQVSTKTRLSAFQVPSSKRNNNKIFRPRNDNYNYEPYDWKNDRLDFVDEESERPWKLDELKQDALTICRQQQEKQPSKEQPAMSLSRWNPFSQSSNQVPQPPINSHACLSTTDAGTLVIDLPAAGVDSQAVSSAVFGALWFSAILPATFAGGLATAAFLLPFWIAGGAVAKKAIVDPFVTCTLTIGKYAWSLESTYGKAAQIRQVEGSTRDLRGASVEDMNLEVNGKSFYEIKLFGEKGVTGFGNGLEPDELEYLSHVINNHLQQVRQDDDNLDNGVHGFISGRS